MSIKVSFTASLLVVAAGWSVAQPVPEVSLAQALQAARQNIEVALAQRSLAAAQADIRAADRAPVPVLSGKLSQMDLQHGLGAGNVLTQKRIDKAIGLDWTWERGNKRALRTQAATAAALAAQADVDDVRLQQLLATHAAYFDTLASQERAEQIQALAHSARQLADTAALRLKVGDLAAQDASRTEIEAERARTDVVSAQLDQQQTALALAQLMGRNGGNTPAALKVVSEWPSLQASTANYAIKTEVIPRLTSAPLTVGELLPLVEARADVRAAQARVQAARALADNASALKTADITVGSSIDHYPGTSTRLLELRAQMPLQGFLGGYNYEGEIARALATQAQAQDLLEKTRLLALTDLQRQQQALQAAAQRVQSFATDIVPRARKVAELAELAYQRGALSLTDLLDARRTLRATLLDSIGARADHARAQGAWALRTAPATVPGAQP
ncbi:MAG: hypothetical protein RLZZ401_1170 [Pseudomonadota bacterium]|jgi:cobalt-zinc-cadmium efflux system outer membrane protein